MTDTFFDPAQRATVEAAMARIIPTDDTPGAVEAGTVDFVDRYLSGIDYIYAKPDGSGWEVLTGPRADAWSRRIEALQKCYVKGIKSLDDLALERHARSFVQLEAEQQDAVLHSLEDPAAGSPENHVALYGAPPEPALQQTNAEIDLDFVALIALHTRQGFYADPIYGGNRDRVGWDVIGFPGPASLRDVHDGTYTVLEWFADDLEHESLRRPAKQHEDKAAHE
jgi:gluconate 2-dehydrogenase gamma chain